jgi:hypothetical protein
MKSHTRSALPRLTVLVCSVALFSGCVDNAPDPFEPAFLGICPSLTCSPLVSDQVSKLDPAGYPLAIGGASRQVLAQVVSPGVDGRLMAIGLPVACAADPRNQLVIDVVDVVAGQPGITVLQRTVIPNAALTGGFGSPPRYRRLDLAAGVPIRRRRPIGFVLWSKGLCTTLPGQIGNPYAGGDSYFQALPNPPGWVPLTTGTGRSDLAFQTWVARAR